MSVTTDDIFSAERPRLFGIAYRMLGSVADAEDVVQEAWLRWRSHAGDDIANPQAYLSRTVTSLSIDALRRTRRERHVYPGPWLPEPLPDAVSDDGEAHLALAQTLSLGLLALLETLTASERATFVLREAYGMAYDDIAACLDARPATCRQWHRRARARLARIDWHDEAPLAGRELLERFLATLHRGDPDALVALLDEDVDLVSDGGGKAVAATRPLHGPRAVSRFLHGIARRGGAAACVDIVRFNGRWGAVIRFDERLDTALSLASHAGRVRGIYLVRNPDKLARLQACRALAEFSATRAAERP